MRVKMNLELKDEPGTLIKALLPISKYGGNIVYIVHDRDKKKANGNITVQISIEANKEQVKEIKNALEYGDIGILSIDEVKLIEELAFIMIGHIVDTDIKDTIDRVDDTGYAEVIDLNLKMPHIKKELEEVKVDNDYIFITGGLGSTHDDVTRDALSLFLKRELIPIDNEIFETADQGSGSFNVKPHKSSILMNYNDIRNTRLQKMIEIPAGTEPIFNDVGGAIGFIIDGKIFVMPGVPEEMRAMFHSIEDKLKGGRFYTQWIVTNRAEADIGDILEEATKRFNVKIGSYPQRDDKGDYILKIKIESTDKTELNSAVKWLNDRFEIIRI